MGHVLWKYLYTKVSVLETETFKSQSQLLRPRLRLSEDSLSFETEIETGKLLMVETETRLTLGYEQFLRLRPLEIDPWMSRRRPRVSRISENKVNILAICCRCYNFMHFLHKIRVTTDSILSVDTCPVCH